MPGAAVGLFGSGSCARPFPQQLQVVGADESGNRLPVAFKCDTFALVSQRARAPAHVSYEAFRASRCIA